jgi:hypothetical protein
VLASILSQLRDGGCTYFIGKLHRNMLERKMTIKKEEEEEELNKFCGRGLDT